jgi:hypothetical protein
MTIQGRPKRLATVVDKAEESVRAFEHRRDHKIHADELRPILNAMGNRHQPGGNDLPRVKKRVVSPFFFAAKN